MKKIFTLLGCVAIIPMFLLLTAYSGDNLRSSGGIWSNSGSPGDGEDCAACHTGNVSTDNSWMTSDIPAAGYIAGQTYTMTLTTTGGGAATKKRTHIFDIDFIDWFRTSVLVGLVKAPAEISKKDSKNSASEKVPRRAAPVLAAIGACIDPTYRGYALKHFTK